MDMDIIILTSILATLFLVFIIGTWKEFSVMSNTSYKDLRILRNGKIKSDDKRKVINKMMQITISDMESDGVYFSEEDKKKLKIGKNEFRHEYTLPPSVMKKNKKTFKDG
jgi:hypothetical protein